MSTSCDSTSVGTMSASEPWECVVVGAGIIGSWTAYHLVLQGVKTLLIEQFVLPHTRGSSHGESRVIEKTDTVFMPEAYDWWLRLEKECGKQLIVPTGELIVQGGDQKELKATLATMKEGGVHFELMDSSEMKRRYPIVDFPADHAAVLAQSGGLLLANRCLNVLHHLFVAGGGVIEDGAPVNSITPGDITTVKTKLRTYHTRRLILAPGPWAKDLLSKINVDVPIKTMPGRFAYWKSLRPKTPNVPELPPMLHWCHGLPEGQYRFVYVMPSEYNNMIKVGTRGEPPARYVHPDSRDEEEKNEMNSLLPEYISKHFPGVETKPSIVEPCIYSMTPDRFFIIDRHPSHANIAFGCGFSGTGHGFMNSPVVGKLLVEIVLRKDPSYDLTPYRWDRNYHRKSLL